MIRALILSALLSTMPRACSCAGTPDGLSGTSADRSPAAVETTGDATGQARGTATGGYTLPPGVGPASGGGKCTAPKLVEGELEVRDPSDGSLEDRLFGTRTGELSVKSPEPCP